MRPPITILVTLLLGLPSSTLAASEIGWHVMASGAVGGQSQILVVHSALGQPVVGEATSSSYRILSGFWVPSATASAAVEDDTTEVPRAFRLGALVPNPFAGTTNISYAVPVGGRRVRIHVYDVRGAMVRVLVDQHQTPGNQAVAWDGLDGSGRRVASGMYLIRMEAPGYRATRKLLLTR